MGYKIEFPSVANPEKYRYIYDSSRYETGPVCSYLYYQEKHVSGDSWRFAEPLPTRFVGDCLMSLAVVMMDDESLCESLYYKMESEPEDELIEFAAKVVYKEGKKKRYFSREFQRVSSVSAKKYDRRWEEILSEHDGSPRAILDFIMNKYGSPMAKYIAARKLRTWWNSDRKRRNREYMDYPAEFIGWTSDRHENYAIDGAWNAVQIAMNIYKQKREFKNCLSEFNQNAMITKLES